MKKDHETTADRSQHSLASETSPEQLRILSHAVEQSPSMVLITDTNGDIQYVNRSFTRVTGYTAEEVMGQNPRILKSGRTHPEEYRKLWTSITLGGDWRGEFENRKKDGGLYWASAVISGLRDAEGEVTHFISLSEDVTERKVLEQTMVSLSERERQSIGRELHDALGQQLTGISLLAKAMQLKVSKCCSDEAEADAVEILSLVNAALSQTRQLSHGLFPVALDRHGLSAALAELTEGRKRLFKVECRFREKGTPVPLDHTTNLHLYRIAQEAVTNALKHGHPTEVSVTLSQKENMLSLTIEDDGSGLPGENDRESGLGLSIMRYRAGMIGCDFRLEATPGGGTKVSCSIRTGPSP